MTLRTTLTTTALFAALFHPRVADGQVDARMLRYPDVSASQIAFVYAGDIWVVPKAGGQASRLSSPEGEEMFPRFSPEGSRIAFSGNYDGNLDVYVVSSSGGPTRRLTHHPAPDVVLDWYPDGQHLLYRSPMASGRQRFNQLYRLSAEGGLPERLPVPYGELGSISADGSTLAYTHRSRDFRTWKRYRGGMAPDIWTFDLRDSTAVRLTDSDANDGHPMWAGEVMYYLSDAGPEERFNIWARAAGGGVRQVTNFSDYDVRFPAIGPSDVVFEAGGRLYLLSLATERYEPVDVDVVSDFATLRSHAVSAAPYLANMNISPTGQRAVVEARGDIFTLPAEHGLVRNLTATSGVAERTPAWSPDGQTVAYWSDVSGEYQLTLRDADGGNERTITSFGSGFRYQPYWSPDGRKLAYIDQAQRISVLDVESARISEVDQALLLTHGGLASFRVSWSGDSRWLAYQRDLETLSTAIFIYDSETGESHQVTAGYYSDSSPQFDPDGKYLYFLSNRTYAPVYGDMDASWIYPNSTNIVAVSLTRAVPSPLAPRNDEEPADDGLSDDESSDDETDSEEADAVAIELDGFESRMTILPPDPGNYADLYAAPGGKVVYRRLPRSGSGNDQSPVVFYDLEEREEQTVLPDADGIVLSADGQKLLAVNNRQAAIVSVAPGQDFEARLALDEMRMTVDPSAEWRQIYSDVWRLQRDYFYDEDMHGLDWDQVREHYGRLLEDAVTRWDVNFVLGEMIAELNASHTYVQLPGDVEQGRQAGVGLLGVDWSLEDGAYRIGHIVRGAPWDNRVRSPLDRPGVDVSEGDYVLAVNGVPLDVTRDPWAGFQGMANETVSLTVNDRPTLMGAREVVVETMSNDTRLRHLEWIERNRRRVEEGSGGRIGYVYVRDTGVDGQSELVRQFNSQARKDGLIIDERFNSGGQIPDRFIELLDRPPTAYWARRDGVPLRHPVIAHFGPKVMLINGWSGSGGDAFPHYFRQAGLGPLIGTRTWGGLIGISGAPRLVDGGLVSVPTFRMYSPDGKWFSEGYGVAPDIEVIEDPERMARGEDPQLERAIEETLRLLETSPVVAPDRPAPERRVANGGR